eukprot:COSAG06_NODE_6352_length_2973_cov_2.356120_3_plen_50_part_00
MLTHSQGQTDVFARIAGAILNGAGQDEVVERALKAKMLEFQQVVRSFSI